MSEGESKEIFTLLIDLNDRSSDNSISEKLKGLKNSGNSKVYVRIKTSTEQVDQKLLLDTDLFRKIKQVQDLPDWVIIKLILVSGKLKESSFKERILNG